MNMEVRQPERSAKARVGIVDCDIHPKSSLEDLQALSEQSLVGLSADLRRSASATASSRASPIPRASRSPRGATPGRRTAVCRRATSTSCASSTSTSTASNRRDEPALAVGAGRPERRVSAPPWRLPPTSTSSTAGTRREPRLQGLGGGAVRGRRGVGEGNQAARRRSRASRMCCFSSRTSELLGKKRYWPIYEAAVEAGRPIGVHVFGSSGRPMSNTGWPSFYIEEITEHSASLRRPRSQA